ncbi:hypothetical protein P692DRAFT_201719975, partial [Suillus brevipes Sb2]
QQGVNRFIQLADDSDEVPNLQGKSYRAFKLSAEEWKKLELIHDVLQFDEFSSAINSGLNNIRKWYYKIDKTDVYFVCLALNPNYKVAYAKGKWEPHDFDEGMRSSQKVFDKYYHNSSCAAAIWP